LRAREFPGCLSPWYPPKASGFPWNLFRRKYLSSRPAHGMRKGTRGSRLSVKVTAKFSIFGTHFQLQNSFAARALVDASLSQQVPSDRSSPLPSFPPTSFQNSLSTTWQNSFPLLLPVPPRPWLKASSAVRICVHDPSS